MHWKSNIHSVVFISCHEDTSRIYQYFSWRQPYWARGRFSTNIIAIYPTLSVALELEAQSKYRLCNPHFVPRGPRNTVVQPVFRSLGEMKIHGLSRQIFEQKAHFEASNFHSFLVPSRQISLAFVNGFRQSKSFIFSLIFKEYIFGMQIDFYSGFEIQLFLNRFSPSISLSSILAS